MRLITRDDLLESILKIYTRGFQFFISKFTLSQSKRTISSFHTSKTNSSNWWIIPRIRERWNYKITGEKNISYEDYIVSKYLSNKTNLKMISLGSGICSHEFKFAKYENFTEIRCVDFSDNILKEAKQLENFNCLVFDCIDINTIELEVNSFDVVLFHSSLHHFKNIDFLLQKINNALTPSGILVVNEYVGPRRLAIEKNLKKEINTLLNSVIPKSYKKRYKTNWTKKKVTGPGLLRMLMSDPSEAVESDLILPTIHRYFKTIEEKPLGGNLCMPLFKDIAHNFITDNRETNDILDKIFYAEDEFIKTNPSNNIFGIYAKKEL